MGRFEVDEGDKGLMIYDHDGVDDYYFVNDEDELKKFCKLINEMERTIRNQNHTITLFEVLAKQQNFQIGSIAYMTLRALDFPDILHITKDEDETATANICQSRL